MTTPSKPETPHVLLHEKELACDPDAQLLLYDATSHAVLAAAGSVVAAHPISSAHQGPRPVYFEVGEGPPIAAMAAAPDLSILAVQRSAAQLQFTHRGSRNLFVQAPRSRAPLLAFCWPQGAACDLAMVTAQGLEMYKLLPGQQGLTLVESRRHPVRWCLYSHDTRMALLGTGEGGSWLQAYQFAAGGCVRLPPFRVGSSQGLQPGSPAPAPEVGPDSLQLLTVYGRVYCCHLDEPARRITLHRIYKDAVVPQHVLEVGPAPIGLSTVDSLLIVHSSAAECAAVHDLLLAGGRPVVPAEAPAFVPLRQAQLELPTSQPAGLDGSARQLSAEPSEELPPVEPPFAPPGDQGPDQLLMERQPSQAIQQWVSADSSALQRPPGVPGLARRSTSQALAAQPSESLPPTPQSEAQAWQQQQGSCWGLRFHLPRLALDAMQGKVGLLMVCLQWLLGVARLPPRQVWRCSVDVAAVAASCTDAATCIAFLQRRTPQLHQPTNLRALSIAVAKDALVRQLPLARVRAMFDALCAACVAALERTRQPGRAPGQQPAAGSLAVPAIDPRMVEDVIFRPLLSGEGSQQYLHAALVEFIDSCGQHGLAVPSSLHLVAVDLLAQLSHPEQVVQTLTSQAALAAPSMALLLEQLEPAGVLGSAGAWVVLDQLARTGQHEAAVRRLLAEGQVLPALRLVRRHRITGIEPETFMEAAARSGKLLHFAAVVRLCKESAEPALKPFATLLAAYQPLLDGTAR